MNEIEARGKIKYRIANEMRKAGENKEEYEDLEIAIQALKEIREYRELGTIEELQKAKEQYDDIHSVAEKTALIGLSDYGTAKGAVITEMKRNLDYSLKEYQSIGTVEEFKALKEKNEPKKPENIYCVKMQSFCEDDLGREIPCTIKSFQFYCPNCKRKIASRFKINNCANCNQKLDWE